MRPKRPAPRARWRRLRSRGRWSTSDSRRLRSCCCRWAHWLLRSWRPTVVATESGRKDPQIVVVDEVLGQWLTLAGALRFNFRTFAVCLRPFPVFRYSETAADTSHRTECLAERDRAGRHDGRRVRRTCLISAGMVQSLLTIKSKAALRKQSDRQSPKSRKCSPEAAITGGELCYSRQRPVRQCGADDEAGRLSIGDVSAQVVIGSDSLVIVKVPEGASAGNWWWGAETSRARSGTAISGFPIADNLHPVTSPAVDAFGNIYTTFSGSRGQKVPVAVYRIDLNFNHAAVHQRHDECHAASRSGGTD